MNSPNIAVVVAKTDRGTYGFAEPGSISPRPAGTFFRIDVGGAWGFDGDALVVVPNAGKHPFSAEGVLLAARCRWFGFRLLDREI